MSNVPLPHPVMNAMLGDDWEDLFTADQMHAYAASVSAAKDAEISRLKHRIALHDPCNGRMAGEPPRYTPECVVLRAEVAGLREDAERYRWLRSQVSGHRAVSSARPATFAFPGPMVLTPLGDIMRGSVAQHLDAAIDAARKGEA